MRREGLRQISPSCRSFAPNPVELCCDLGHKPSLSRDEALAIAQREISSDPTIQRNDESVLGVTATLALACYAF